MNAVIVLSTLAVAVALLGIVALLLAELVRAVGWCVAGLTTSLHDPARERTVAVGAACAAAGVFWLTASAEALGWTAKLILGGPGESVLWGAVALDVLIALWWLATLRLHRVRQAARQNHMWGQRPVTRY